MPWWGIALIAVAALILGAAVAGAGVLLYIGRGMWPG